MFEYFRSHIEPHAENQNKDLDAALMNKLKNTLFSIDRDTEIPDYLLCRT